MKHLTKTLVSAATKHKGHLNCEIATSHSHYPNSSFQYCKDYSSCSVSIYLLDKEVEQ